MKEILADVLVFKTDIEEARDLVNVAAAIRREPRIRKWNVDQDDVDNVLRIEAERISPMEIKILIHSAGYHCEELPD
jgi:short-subunit dehydrogenase